VKINEMISAVQTALGIEADGKAGPETWGAIYNKIVSVPDSNSQPLTDIDTVDARSEKVIASLLPEVQSYARALVHKAADAGVTIKIISGLRTYQEQDALYAQGRTTPGDKVTNAKGGQSNHNFGIAFDIGVFEGNKYLSDLPKYKTVGILGVDLGLEWGGNWKTITDQPHFQLRPNWAKELTEKNMLAELRSRKASGENYFA
jgi:peptidoglycan L-alanyl-D-glutamate endopeptidase CwlK